MRNEMLAAVEYFKSLLETIADDEWNREARNSATAALSALRDALQRQPDPITGLVTCGCGGKPVFIEFFDGFFDHERITCSECQIEFTTTSVGCGALLWNKAMGWRGDNES